MDGLSSGLNVQHILLIVYNFFNTFLSSFPDSKGQSIFVDCLKDMCYIASTFDPRPSNKEATLGGHRM